MTQLRLDQVEFSTLHEAPKNYDTIQAGIAISGTIADGDTANFSATIPYSRAGTRADLYIDGNGRRALANSGSRASDVVYVYASSETFSVLIAYSSTDITITVSIFNGTGSPLSLAPQTLTVIAVLIDAPIGAL